MQIAACVTTRNRIEELENCLKAIWNSSIRPSIVVVSDDSIDSSIQEQNQEVVKKYPNAIYLAGPRRGVCANRNNAVNALSETDFVAFVDDDICLTSDFIATALAHYEQMPADQQKKTILTGFTQNQYGHITGATKLSFRGYFCTAVQPEAVNIHAAVFPRDLFKIEQWDENIFFGYEDAELCLRALKREYKIKFCPDLKALHTCYEQGTLATETKSALTDYQIHIEAARLYVGIKRYSRLFPDFFKLIAFILIYFAHMSIYLLRKRAITAFPKIIRCSKFPEALRQELSQKITEGAIEC